MLHLIFVLCLRSVVGGNIMGFQYEEFHNADTKPPVYIEERQKIEVFTESWEFLTSINISYYDDELKHVETLVSNTSALCIELDNELDDYVNQILKVKIECKRSVTLIENILKGMNKFDSVKLDSHQVTKKALLAHLEQGNETKALSNVFMANSVTWIRGSTQLFNGNISENLTYERNHHDKQIDDIRAELKRQTRNNDLKASRIKNYLQDIILYTTLVLTRFRERHESLIQMVEMKNMRNDILPTTVLLNALIQMADVIEKRGKTLPFNIQDEPIRNFYNIATIQKWMFKNQLIIVYILPIVDQQFKLYQLTPYPSKIEGEIFQLMLPEVDQIALNSHSYIIINEEDMEKCYRKGNNTLLCPLTGPVVSIEKSGLCVVDLLTNFEVSNNCNYRIMKLYNELWLRVYESNCWLFVLPKPQRVAITCEGAVVDNRYINGVGTLSLEPGCFAKSEFVLIVAFEDASRHLERVVPVRSEMEINWKNITKIVNASKLDNIEMHTLPRVINGKHLDILEKMSTSVREALDVESAGGKQLCDCENIKILIIVVLVVLLVFLVVGGCCGCCLMFQKCCKRSLKKVQAANTNSMNDFEFEVNERNSYVS